MILKPKIKEIKTKKLLNLEPLKWAIFRMRQLGTIFFYFLEYVVLKAKNWPIY